MFKKIRREKLPAATVTAEESEKLKQALEREEILALEKKRLEDRVLSLEKALKDKEKLVENLSQEKIKLIEETRVPFLKDKGYQTLLGFKLIPPFLDQVIGRPFMMTISEEFNYKTAADRDSLNARRDMVAKSEGPGFHTFRDEIKPEHSFRTVYYYSSKEYFISGPKGKISVRQFMFPEDLVAGVEISSQYKSAMYLSLHHRSLKSAVLPQQVFGAPLLSYAFPIFSDNGQPIGAVSFSNDISHIVKIATELGNVVSTENDTVLENLAHVLKNELEFTRKASEEVKEEALFSQKTAETIRKKGQEVIEISERLKVLALNTAIESTKVGGNGKGVGVIAGQMKQISEITRKSLKEIYDESLLLDRSSKKVFHHSQGLEQSSIRLKEESSVLFNTSLKITSQKDELASLVRLSIDEITQSQDDLNAIFTLIQQEKKTH